MKNAGKRIIEDNWPPKYTDKIAATGTDETKTPNKIPIEHVIAMEEILIIKDSNVSFKKYSEKPTVNASIINPTIKEISTAIIKHKYTAKNFAINKLLRLTGLIRNNS